ncbi:hypothetical protein DFA_10349 [Cavenderia fasciculata]|uniref:Uncharacterized protein n=1 Tax=Cavenderia fasciculata TaxID=261658 RepID=F4Q9Y9_CACFS|nr:uncharacterized protein DFA_10349 [Cavenderia fasciculata]EGG15508.1 hypothetical protein DFA_10349 [Cavenderia fasciculata]|eukprot:XP_004354250.1 hypothetical protein DFA_10349 [Cavenderia fasciculata]
MDLNIKEIDGQSRSLLITRNVLLEDTNKDRCYFQYGMISTILLLKIINLIDDNLDLICLLMTCRSFYRDFIEKFKPTLPFKHIPIINDPPSSSSSFSSLSKWIHLNNMEHITKKCCYPMKRFESLFQNALANQMIQDDWNVSINSNTTPISNVPITKNLTTLHVDCLTSIDKYFQFPPTLTNLSIEYIQSPDGLPLIFPSSLVSLSVYSSTLLSLDNLLSLETLEIKGGYNNTPVIKNLLKLKHLKCKVRYLTTDLPSSLESLKLSETSNIVDSKYGALPSGLKKIKIIYYSIKYLTILDESDCFDIETPIRLPRNLISLKSNCNLNLQLSLPPTLTKLCVPRFTGITSIPSSIRFLRTSTISEPQNGQCIERFSDNTEHSLILPSNIDRLDLDLDLFEPLRIDDILFQTNITRLNIYRFNKEKIPFQFQIRRLSKDTSIMIESKTSFGGFIQFKQSRNHILSLESCLLTIKSYDYEN